MPHSMQFSKRLKRDKLSGTSTGLDGNPARADSSTLSGSEASASQVIAILAADMRWKKAAHVHDQVADDRKVAERIEA